MLIADNIIREKIKNVYFLWGRGKTSIANELSRRYGFFIYDVDKSRYRHLKDADPFYQPTMCRDFEKEYGVTDFWELPPDVIAEREKLWLNEFTPMAIVDLILLSPRHKVIICEGDMDVDTVIPAASHMVFLLNRGTKFDWFDRPGHDGSLNAIRNRPDLTEKEKNDIINNAYSSVGTNEGKLPGWVGGNGVKTVIWDDSRNVGQTALEVADYFGFPRR